MQIGRGLIVIGILLVLAGILLLVFPRIVSWFGNLPGDIRFEGKNSRVYIPLTSMILLSIILTIVLNLAIRIYNHFK